MDPSDSEVPARHSGPYTSSGEVSSMTVINDGIDSRRNSRQNWNDERKIFQARLEEEVRTIVDTDNRLFVP